MKKKIIIFLFSLLAIFSITYIRPKDAIANCLNNIGNVCDSRPISCKKGLFVSCCATIQECIDFNGYVVNGTPEPQVKFCGNGDSGIETAIGCIPLFTGINNIPFIAFLLRWATGIGGGIAFILILYAGFMIMSSAGNPERLKAGQELLTSAISGIILLIFSIFILRFIGVDILGLGSFGFGGP